MTSILKAVRRAESTAHNRHYDTIFWAIDLHGVILHSTYAQGHYQVTNEHAITFMRYLGREARHRIIIWSSCHHSEKEEIIAFLLGHDIKVDYFNENPEVENTHSGFFGEKFYFSILLDDKAGFDPETDWVALLNYYNLDLMPSE